MAQTDNILIPLTAKKIGPSASSPARGAKPRVFYLKPSDLNKLNAHSITGNAIIQVKHNAQKAARKVELYETPDEVIAAEALAQGATANGYFSKAYAVAAPTSSATAADQTTLKYLNDVVTNVASAQPLRLPDPFTRRLVIVNNQTTGSITILGRGTTSPINGSTANYTITAGKRIHFLAPTASTAGTTAGWRTATDA